MIRIAGSNSHPHNRSLGIDIDAQRSRLGWQSWHGHNVPCQDIYESSARSDASILDGNAKPLRPPQTFWIVRQRVLSLGKAYRQSTMAHERESLELPLGDRRQFDAVSTIDSAGYRIEFFFERSR